MLHEVSLALDHAVTNYNEHPTKYWAWKKAKSTKKKKDWDRYEHLKRETRRANRQAYKQCTSKATSEDTTKHLWQLIKNKKCDAEWRLSIKMDSLQMTARPKQTY